MAGSRTRSFWTRRPDRCCRKRLDRPATDHSAEGRLDRLGPEGCPKTRGRVIRQYCAIRRYVGYHAVEHVPGVAGQIVCLLRPCHGAHEHVAGDDVGLDGADAGEPSEPSVSSMATRAVAGRAMPSLASSGALRSRSRQREMLAGHSGNASTRPMSTTDVGAAAPRPAGR
jgi:hypothetical protein